MSSPTDPATRPTTPNFDHDGERKEPMVVVNTELETAQRPSTREIRHRFDLDYGTAPDMPGGDGHGPKSVLVSCTLPGDGMNTRSATLSDEPALSEA